MATSESLGPLSLGCETPWIRDGAKTQWKSYLSQRSFERDIQDIICYTGSFSDCKKNVEAAGGWT